MDSKVMKTQQCSPEKSHAVLNEPILNYNQDLALFRQKQILRSDIHKHLQKQSNEYFFIQLLNVWRYILPIITSFPHVCKNFF